MITFTALFALPHTRTCFEQMELRDELSRMYPAAKDVPIVVGSLEAGIVEDMVAEAQVVINVVAPYTTTGEPIVAACVRMVGQRVLREQMLVHTDGMLVVARAPPLYFFPLCAAADARLSPRTWDACCRARTMWTCQASCPGCAP